MPILDIQKRARELGRIRIGHVVPTKNGKTRPEKLDLFRLTSASRPLLEKVAELYGGEVAEWQPQGGGAKAWEVVTNSTRLPIMVPPQPVSQWYEFWTAGGCKHRCDGRTNVLTDEFCDPEDPAHRAALERPTTRLNVVLRDVEGIGVWRLETHGWNAAVELPDAAEFLARAGGYVNGWVSLEARTSKAENPRTGKTETRHFMVPIIEIDVTPAELMAGGGRVAAPSLEGPVQAPALAAPAPAVEAPAESAVRIPTPEQVAAADAGTLRQMLEYLEQAAADHPATGAVRAALAKATEQPAPAAVPDAEGVYDAEVVDDSPTAPAAAPVAPGAGEPDPDQVWQQILKAASDLRGWGLSELVDDFKRAMSGVIPDEATGAELAQYLHLLQTGEAA